LVKINIIGDGAVGKSALLQRYITKTFKSTYMNTIGADCIVYSTNVDGNDVKFQIWDLAGQPKYGSVRPIYFGGSVGIVMVYDITRENTYRNAMEWLDEAFKHTGRGPAPVILLANKEDLRYEIPNPLTDEHGLELARKIDKKYSNKGVRCSFFKTSAKTGKNVDKAFKKLGSNILTYIEILMADKLEHRINYGKIPRKV
jgi:small GTP-binding protein